MIVRRLYDWCASWRTLIKDEKGNYSSARCGLWLLLFFSLAVTGSDVWGGYAVEGTVYGFLAPVLTVFVVWAAGPRIAEYIGPQIGALAAALTTKLTASAGVVAPVVRPPEDER